MLAVTRSYSPFKRPMSQIHIIGGAGRRSALIAACALIAILNTLPAKADVIRFGSVSKPHPASSIVRFGLTPEPEDKSVASTLKETTRGLRTIAPSSTVLADIHRVAQRYAHAAVASDVGLSKTEWPLFLQAMIRVESGYSQGAISSAGAIGLAQLMPATAADLGVDPTDPIENLDGGARYLLQQMRDFGGLELALAAYNAGPGAVQKYNGIPPYTETQTHVVKVMREFDRLRQQS